MLPLLCHSLKKGKCCFSQARERTTKTTVTEPIPKEGRRETHEDTECNNYATGCQNYLELRLGMSLTNGLEAEDGKGSSYEGGACPRYLTTQDGLVIHQRNGTGLGGSKRGFSEITGGFVHPWSLAARQEKAALEQAHQKSSHFSTVTRVVHPPQLVGWPPVRSFRRNLGVQNQSKSKMNSEPNVEEIKIAEKESMHNELQERPTMFVKVNIEGCTVGRKIDLKLYNDYDSLSHALQKLFRNFLYVNYLNNPKQDEPDAVTSPSYILLYEDNEGDRMLVGDVPWDEKIVYHTGSKITQTLIVMNLPTLYNLVGSIRSQLCRRAHLGTCLVQEINW